MENGKWDRFEDGLDWDRFINEGYAELSRKYVKDNQYLVDSKTLNVVVTTSAKGITAFLSFQNDTFPSKYGISLMRQLRGNMPVDIEGKIFPTYFDICLTRLILGEEIREKFQYKRRGRDELMHQHIEDEMRFLVESNLLFDEVMSSQKSYVDEIKEVVAYYPEWVKNTHLKAELHKAKSVSHPRTIINKPGRPKSNPKPIKDYFTKKISDTAIDNLLNVLKLKSKDYKPIQFVFMIKAIEELGYISFHENSEIFSAFENFLGSTYGHISGKNSNMGKARNRSNNELLIRMKTMIENIIEEYRLKN